MVGWFHQVEKLRWNRQVVGYCVRSAQCVHWERGEMAGVTIARLHEPNRSVRKLGQFQFG